VKESEVASAELREKNTNRLINDLSATYLQGEGEETKKHWQLQQIIEVKGSAIDLLYQTYRDSRKLALSFEKVFGMKRFVLI